MRVSGLRLDWGREASRRPCRPDPAASPASFAHADGLSSPAVGLDIWRKPAKLGEMKTALILFMLLAASAVPAQTNQPPACFRQPLRRLGGGWADLTPLFQWWEQQGTGTSNPPAGPAGVASIRPMGAWKRITGRKTGEGEGVWMVEAEIATSAADRTNEWILLRDPPAEEESEFYRLQGLLAQYDAQITNDQRQYKTYEAAEKKTAAQARAAAQGDKWERENAGAYQQRATEDRAAAAAARADEKQTEAARTQARQQLGALPSAEGQYKLDCFALEVGRNRSGQRIFDRGAVPDNPP